MNVFDTSAVLAMLYGEHGRARAEARLDAGVICVVNAAEVLGDYVASGRGDMATAQQAFEALGLELAAPDYAQARRVAGLRRRGLSLGDRFCLALGEARGTRVVTADQKWAEIADLSVPLEMIR